METQEIKITIKNTDVVSEKLQNLINALNDLNNTSISIEVKTEAKKH